MRTIGCTPPPDYTYDAAGNMLHDATSGLDYSWDQENRLTGAACYTYTYDSDNNRVSKKPTLAHAGSDRKAYLYSPQPINFRCNANFTSMFLVGECFVIGGNCSF